MIKSALSLRPVCDDSLDDVISSETVPTIDGPEYPPQLWLLGEGGGWGARSTDGLRQDTQHKTDPELCEVRAFLSRVLYFLNQ